MDCLILYEHVIGHVQLHSPKIINTVIRYERANNSLSAPSTSSKESLMWFSAMTDRIIITTQLSVYTSKVGPGGLCAPLFLCSLVCLLH